MRSKSYTQMKPNPDLVRAPSKHYMEDGTVFWMWTDALGRDFVQYGEELKWKYHSNQEPPKSTESDVPF